MKYLFLFVLLFVADCALTQAQLNENDEILSANEEVKKELDLALKNAQLEYNIPAMAVAIIRSGQLFYATGFGYLDEAKTVPVTQYSLFRVASISKLFTAQAIMQLIEKQKMGLDDPIAKFLPSFQSHQVTIRQLLTHSSGLTDKMRPASVERRRSHQAYLASISESFAGRVDEGEFEYSDTGFNLLGSVVSAVSGQTFETYVRENILMPAHMNSSGFFDGENGVEAEALPTYQGKLIGKADQRPYDPDFYPSEGLVSNIYDLANWLISTVTYDAAILGAESYKAMLVPQIKTSWGDIYMGLGWQVYEQEGNFVARHPGSIRGYKSLVLSYPEDQSAIILLTNSSGAPRWKITNLIRQKLKSFR